MDIDVEMMDTILDELEDHLTSVEELLSFESKDYDEVFRIFHTVKSNLNLLGLKMSGQLVHALETKLTNFLNTGDKVIEDLNEQLIHELENISCALIHGLENKRPVSLNQLEEFDACVQQQHERFKGQNTKVVGPEKRVLFVDDEEDYIDVIEEFVRSVGDLDIISTTNGVLAKKQVMQSKFDLIITDYYMPKMNGIDFIKWLRNSDLENANVPIILLTGFKPELEVNDKMWVGVFFLEKPVTQARLRYYINCALRQKRAA